MKEALRPETSAVRGTAVPPAVREVLHSPGQALPETTRSLMESRFGHDFSRVRVHTDEHAAASADAIDANAYAFGNHIAFALGRFDTHSESGQRLIAHELAHVVQHERADAGPAAQRISSPSDTAEHQADAAAAVVTSGARPTLSAAAPAGTIARDEKGSDKNEQAGGRRVTVTLRTVGDCRQPEEIARAIPGARSMLFAAENLMMSYPYLDPVQQRFIDSIIAAHFGSSDESVRRTFQVRVMRMSRTLDLASRGEVTFDCSAETQEKCRKNPMRGAFVTRGEPRTIHICPPFYAGLEERRLLLIHEAAHLAGAWGGEEHYLFRTGPIMRADCLQPTTMSSTEALANADTYAWTVWCLTREEGVEIWPDVNLNAPKQGGKPKEQKK